MKLSLIFSIFTYLFVTPAPIKNDLSRELLRGKVKSCTVALYTVSRGGGVEKRWFVKKTKTDYNMNGFKTRVTRINEWGRNEKSWEYKYDAKGQLIDDSPERDKTTEVVKNGSRIETITSYSGVIEIKKYGTDKLLKERVTLDQEGKVLSSARMTNNKKGYKIKEEDFGKDGKSSQAIMYTYDDYDNLIEMMFYNSTNVQTSKITYTYATNNGALLERAFYDSAFGSLQWVKSTKFTKPDQYKNWLQSIETRDGDSPFLKIREIEYYPN